MEDHVGAIITIRETSRIPSRRRSILGDLLMLIVPVAHIPAVASLRTAYQLSDPNEAVE